MSSQLPEITLEPGERLVQMSPKVYIIQSAFFSIPRAEQEVFDWMLVENKDISSRGLANLLQALKS